MGPFPDLGPSLLKLLPKHGNPRLLTRFSCIYLSRANWLFPPWNWMWPKVICISVSVRILEGSQCAFIIHTSELARMLVQTHILTHGAKDVSSQMWPITESMFCNLGGSAWVRESGLNTIATKLLKLAESGSNFCLIEPLGLNKCFEIHTSACSSHDWGSQNWQLLPWTFKDAKKTHGSASFSAFVNMQLKLSFYWCPVTQAHLQEFHSRLGWFVHKGERCPLN